MMNILERIGAAKRKNNNDRLHPTAAGLLMLGEEYRILYEYPEYFLDYREMLDPSIRWTDRVHGVVIKKEIKEIIMENPGYIRTGKEQMLKGGISDPRNKALMKMFNMIGIGERAGSGVPDIYAVWETQGWREPVVEEIYNPDRTILTLSFEKSKQKKQAEKTSRKNKQNSKSVENKRKILDFLDEEGSCKAIEIAEYIGLSSARTRVLLSQLADEGKIQREGNGKLRQYRRMEEC